MGLVHGFGQKLEFFSIVCVWTKQAEKYCLLIFQIEKKVFFNVKISFQIKWQNWNFCNGVSPWFSSKIRIFFIVCFWTKQAEKYCFLILQIEKQAFFNIKISSRKNGKIRIFAKGLVYGFGQKLEFFPQFVFGQNRPRNIVC